MVFNSFARPVSIYLLPFGITLLFFSSAGCQISRMPFKTIEKPINNLSISKKDISPLLPEANIFIDEIRLAKPYAIIGGTVENVGSVKLEKLSIDLELRRRGDDGLVKKEILIEPSDLSPGEKGKFSLRVFSDEWSGSRVLSLRSASRQEEITFKPLPGSKRPPEKLPEGKAFFDNIRRKRTKPSGEEFLNTPDTPIKVP